jgi:hypothetical protein
MTEPRIDRLSRRPATLMSSCGDAINVAQLSGSLRYESFVGLTELAKVVQNLLLL